MRCAAAAGAHADSQCEMPSPLKPSGQRHLKLPAVLTHSASAKHVCVFNAHSSMSEQGSWRVGLE